MFNGGLILGRVLGMKGIEGDGGVEPKKMPEFLLELLVAQLN